MLSNDPLLALIFIWARITSVGPLRLNTTVPFSLAVDGAVELTLLGLPMVKHDPLLDCFE